MKIKPTRPSHGVLECRPSFQCAPLGEALNYLLGCFGTPLTGWPSLHFILNRISR